MLLAIPDLGERNMSQLLRLVGLLAQCSTIDPNFLKQMWLQRPPFDMQEILSVSSSEGLIDTSEAGGNTCKTLNPKSIRSPASKPTRLFPKQLQQCRIWLGRRKLQDCTREITPSYSWTSHRGRQSRRGLVEISLQPYQQNMLLLLTIPRALLSPAMR